MRTMRALRTLCIGAWLAGCALGLAVSGEALRLPSPCKINLFLRILGRRPTTGYRVSLCDVMSFSLLPEGATKDTLVCSDTSLAIDDSNLVIKAMNLMREKTGQRKYFAMSLDKHVPIQAGLGGGSGNAATAMYAFNALVGHPASNDELKLWSADIGSDITFFFSPGTAYCTGRGEIVAPMAPLKGADDCEVHIFKPREGLSTALVFRALDLSALATMTAPEKILAAHVKQGPVMAAQAGMLVNDLEAPAFKCAPSLLLLKDSIREELLSVAGDGGVMMSGSGTSVYAIVQKSTETGAVAAREAAIQRVLGAHPTVRHFKCTFLSKKDTARDWYSL